MSGEREIVDSTAGEKDAPTSAVEAKNGSTDPPAAFNPGAPIDSIRDRLARIVHRELEKMERGEIEVLSEQHNSMLQQLASLSVSSSPAAPVTLSESYHSNSVTPVQTASTYAAVLSAPKAVTFTPNDVRSLPRLNGSADVDVAEVLSQFRLVVGFRAKSVAPNDDKFADNLAFEHLSLICDGPCLTLYQQLMSGRIDWSANVVNAENVNNPGSFSPPTTWEELKLAILDILMPANSVEECAIKLATFKSDKGETVSASALRFRALMSRFESAVERHAKGRTPWSAITVTLWQHSLPPALQLLQSGEKPVTSFKEAVERARRHEAARLTGAATVSAMSFTPVPNRAAVRQLQQSSRQQPRQQRQQGRQQAGRNGRRQQQSNQQRKPRPHCTYDRCDKPAGHWESTCLQKARDLRERNRRSSGASKRDRSSSPRGNLRHRSRRDRDDDDEDDHRSQASSTNGDGN